MTSVDELVKELEESAEPYYIWEKVKTRAQKGTAAVRNASKYITKVKGPDLIKRVEDYAKDFYSAMGYAGSGSVEMLAHNLRTLLGDAYGAFRSALKHGDIDEANKLAKDALINEGEVAHTSGIIERISQLGADARVIAGKKMANVLGRGKDYVEAITNVPRWFATLKQYKHTAEAYK